MPGKGFFGSINGLLDKFFHLLNTNKYFLGVVMLIMNLGSKYIIPDVSAPFHKALLTSKMARRFIIFCILFIVTRDVKVSFILTAAFIIIFLNLFDDRSKLCILPKSYRNLDTNLDGEITPDEIERAYKILQKTGKLPKEAEKQKQAEVQHDKQNPNKININLNNRNNNSTTKYDYTSLSNI